MDRKIDFLIIGAQKAGTTSLHYYLKQHPDIFMPDVKEIDLFAKDYSLDRTNGYLDIYYKKLKGQKIVGMSYVNLLYFPSVPEKVHAYNPNMKLIALLRNPIDRAYSAYWYMRSNGWETCCSFEEALIREQKGVLMGYFDMANFTYLAHGHYSEQIRPFLALFGRDKIKIILTEDFKKRTSSLVKSVVKWIGLDFDENGIALAERYNEARTSRCLWLQRLLLSENSALKRIYHSIVPRCLWYHINQRVTENLIKKNTKRFNYPPMSAETRLKLVGYFLPHNEDLSNLIEKDLTHWNR